MDIEQLKQLHTLTEKMLNIMEEHIYREEERDSEEPVQKKQKSRKIVKPMAAMQKVKQIQSKTNNDVVYEVDIKNLTCTCPDYTYRSTINKLHQCKHIREELVNEKRVEPVVKKSVKSTIIEVSSEREPDIIYFVDTVNVTCTCPAFTNFSKRNATYQCKHIRGLSLDEVADEVQSVKSEPVFKAKTRATPKSVTKVASKSDPSVNYSINSIEMTCDCPDFTYRGSKIAGYRCKHLKEALTLPEIQTAPFKFGVPMTTAVPVNADDFFPISTKITKKPIDDVRVVNSDTTNWVKYSVNLTKKTCTCPDYTHGCIRNVTTAYVCKHLAKFNKPFVSELLSIPEAEVEVTPSIPIAPPVPSMLAYTMGGWTRKKNKNDSEESFEVVEKS